MKTVSRKGKYAMLQVIICNIGSASPVFFLYVYFFSKMVVAWNISAAPFSSKHICWICRKTEDVLLVTSPLILLLAIGITGFKYVIQNCHSNSAPNPGTNNGFCYNFQTN